MTGYANWQSDEVESLVPVGSTPTSVTDSLIPWSNGEDTCVTCRKVMVRFHPGSLAALWSVGAVAARRRGKAEDWVRSPDGPLTEHGRLVQREDAWLATRRSGFDSPAGPLNGLMVQRDDTALAWRKSEFDSRWVH